MPRTIGMCFNGVAMTVEIRKAAHRHWLQQVLERGDDSDLEAWLSPAHVLHQSLVPHLEPGPRALQQLVRRLRVVFHPWLVQVAEQVCEGDCVMTRFTAHGRHIGAIGPMQPTGAWTPVSAMLMTRFSGALAYESWLEANALEVLFAMGALRPRAGALSSP